MALSSAGALFAEYVKQGWVLVPISPGTKQPSLRYWSDSEHCIRHPIVAGRLVSAGLAHAYSGTCALDIDDIDVAREALAELGLDFDRMMADPKMVRIDSGIAGHAKFLFRVETPLPSKVLAHTPAKRHAVQLRCATAEGKTVQDVLPPSIHPDTGSPYRWAGDWHQVPLLPQNLWDWWQERLASAPAAATPAPTEDVDAVAELLENVDPDCNYTEWIRIGMAIHHETRGSKAGFHAWDSWSSGGEKYKGPEDLWKHWRSFGRSATPVTLGSLHQERIANPEDFPVVEEAPAKEHKPFDPIHVHEWATRPPPTWLIERILPQADLSMLYGGSGAGKSFLALDIGMAVARGVPWRGFEVVQGPVAWIAAEAAGSMRNRVRAYAHAHELDLKQIPFWIIGETPMLAEKKHVAALAVAALKVQARLIVVDTLAAASGGVNENSPDMGAILAGCRAMHKATGALVLLVHHIGKDASRGERGWTGIRAAMHTSIEVVRTTEPSVRVATIRKQRDEEEGAVLPFTLKVVPADMEHTSCVVEHLSQATMQHKLPQTLMFDIEPVGVHIQSAVLTAQVVDTTDFEDLL